MPDLERKKITIAGPTGGTMQGKGAIGFGLLLNGIGLAIVLVAAGVIPVDERSFHAPRWAVGALGACFALVGDVLLIAGVRRAAQLARSAPLRQRFPAQPWLWDHPWDQRGITDDNLARAGKTLGILAFCALFLAPFHWVWLSQRDWMFGAVCLLFDVVLTLALGWAGHKLLQVVKFGRTRVAWPGLPLRPDAPIELTLAGLADAGDFTSWAFTLRFVAEAYETRHKAGGESTTDLVHYQLWADTLAIADPARELRRGQEVRLRFAAPGVPLSTSLSSRPRRYWQLEARGKTHGVDFQAYYPLPIYAAEQAPVAADAEPALAGR